MNNTHKHPHSDPWESGELGASEKFVRKASVKQEKAIDEKLGLQVISIRLQKTLIEELKILAKEDGMGYQPYIRQQLTQHVRHKKKQVRHLGVLPK